MDYFFINHNKKQIASTKKVYGSFEDAPQLLAFLSFSLGDKIEIETEQNEFVEELIFDNKHKDYKYIVLSDYKISQTDDLYRSSEYARLVSDLEK